MSKANYLENFMKLHSNEAINPISRAANFIFGNAPDIGIRGVVNSTLDDGFELTSDAIKNTISKSYMKPRLNKAGEQLYNNEGRKLMTPNAKAIAGTYIGASLAGRIVGGGGVYKDSNGNTDIAGVPFI